MSKDKYYVWIRDGDFSQEFDTKAGAEKEIDLLLHRAVLKTK